MSLQASGLQHARSFTSWRSASSRGHTGRALLFQRIDFSRNPEFGYVGQAFIAQFGDQSSMSGKVLAPVGFKVVRVDPATGVVQEFAVNKGSTNGPASKIDGGGFERPEAARFDPRGTALYIVDFGVMTFGQGAKARQPGKPPYVAAEPRKGAACSGESPTTEKEPLF